ncbi:PAS domain-containing sensor histidine kinase [Laspinema olomoucense]|uniref:histidine kinase n=1 Tax=Laspinema olomoucense D3b TaxID=2953688 RepID=A0ABT2N0C9_9CYAN|nr:PAS domain S-box protein [Laspinema sp. D3b]MCT7976121.1 PAS domain S-box protein [Laspinema sp. D3b]
MRGVSQNQEIGDDADRPHNRQKLLYWTVGFTAIAIAVAGIGIYLLDRMVLSQGRSHLEQTVQIQAQLIQGIATLTATPQTAWESAQEAYQLPPPSGMRVAIAWVETDGSPVMWQQGTARDRPWIPVIPDSELAHLIQRAIVGETDSQLIADEQGIAAIVAYAPIPELKGAVLTQLEVGQIRSSYLPGLAIASGIASLMICATGILFVYQGNRLLTLEKRNSQQYQAMLEAAPEGTIAITDGGKIHWINTAALELFGYSKSELQGQNLKLLMPWLMHQEINAYLTLFLNTRQMPGESNAAYELVGQRKNGTTFPIELAIAHVRLPQGQLYTLFVRDITERKRAQEKLQESYNLLQAISEGTTDSIFVKDLQGRYLSINSAGAKAMGKPIDEILGKNDTELLSPETARQRMKNDHRILLEGETQLLEEEIVPLNASSTSSQPRTYLTSKTVYRSAQGYAIGLIGVARDISGRVEAETALRDTVERLHRTSGELQEKNQQLEATLTQLQRTQTQLIQSEKMSSLGQMVAGIAHEINNPVNFISGNLGYVRDYLENLLDLVELYRQQYGETDPIIADKLEDIELDFLQEDLQKILGSMKVGTDRIRGIVRSLRTFSRLDEAEMKQVNIHEGIESALLILQGRLKATVERPEIQIIPEFGILPAVECYAGQLNQVFMNLLNNAIDALEEKYRKNLGETPPNSPDFDSPTIRILTAVTGDRVTIRIIDNGPGMTPEIQARLFDPFFTTKPVGKGTGLGLSVCYQIIVEKHKGHLSCHATPDLGSEFSIEIPIFQGLT